MVLGQWLERGLGQILAPDENYEPDPVAQDTNTTSFWNIVAPDPNFIDTSNVPAGTPSSAKVSASTSSRVPPESAFLSPGSKVDHGPMVRCIHCHRDTPATLPTPARELYTPPPVSQLMSPSSSQPRPHPEDPEHVELFQGVAKNAYAHADSMRSPGNVKDKRREFLRLCASNKPLKKKATEKLRRLITNDKTLAACRATDLGGSVPNGYTPFMAAAYTNNISAAEILLEVMGPYLLTEVETMGKTPMHIAAEYGHLEMVEFLQEREREAFGPEATAIPKVDIMGQTALGLGLTSPEGKAKTNKKQLEKILFSPKDRSIFGSPAPVQQRAKTDEGLGIVYGVADMPGMRVNMEDAMIATKWQQASLGGGQVALFGVCDGHGDYGQVSNYVAAQLPMVLPDMIAEHTTDAAAAADVAGAKANVDWSLCCKSACMQVDTELKKVDVPGGSTAVLALVTNDTIVVANVGDSRCILIQQTTTQDKSGGVILEEAVAQLSLKESPPSGSDKPAAKKNSTTYNVKAMSHDHKPELEEEQARIEKAGMKVVSESFQEDGQEIVIHKVELSSDERIACSRSFGDFEYKANESLGDEEQAIVAVPDVMIHERDSESDSYLVLACDGVWDVMTNEQVADFVVEHVELLMVKDEVGILPSVGDQLLAECLRLGSTDNMSVIVVALSKTAEKLSGGKILQGKTLDFTE